MEISIALHHSYVLNCCSVFELPSPFFCPLSSDLSWLIPFCVLLCPLVCLISTVFVLWSPLLSCSVRFDVFCLEVMLMIQTLATLPVQ